MGSSQHRLHMASQDLTLPVPLMFTWPSLVGYTPDGVPQVVREKTVGASYGDAFLAAVEVPILPRHVLGSSLADGSFGRRWGIDAKPSELVGTGPFRMKGYVPAQWIEYERNPDYWRRDADGRRLPLTNNVIVDQAAALDLIDQLRVAVPEEIRAAKRINSEGERILEKAQADAEETLARAQEQAAFLIEERGLADEARRISLRIIADAEAAAGADGAAALAPPRTCSSRR